MNDSEKSLLIHVGFPKTGTTTLQSYLFPSLNELHYFGKAKNNNPFSEDSRLWIKDFRDVVNHADDFHAAKSCEAIGKKITESIINAPHHKSIISLEGITNPFVDLHGVQLKDIYRKANHLAAILRIVKEKGVKVSIIITVRSQVTLLPSLFSQIYLQGFTSGLFGKTYESFIDFMFENRLIGQGPALYFYRLASLYEELFGLKNVSVVEMTQIFSGKSCRGTEDLANFLGRPESEILKEILGKKSNARKVVVGGKPKVRMMTNSPGSMEFRETTGINTVRHAFPTLDYIKIIKNRPVYWNIKDQSAKIYDYYKNDNLKLSKKYGIEFI